MSSANDFENLARNVFHKIHTAQVENQAQFDRTLFLASPKNIGVDSSFFKDKVCLEAGCGSYAPATQSMLQQGARKVYALDLNETIYELAPKYLSEYEGRYELIVGSVLKLPFEDSSLDFVLCDGVLPLTTDPIAGLRELCRVVKPGGSLFISLWGAGGFLKAITKVAHDLYETNPAWTHFIDNLSADTFKAAAKWLCEQMGKHGDHEGQALLQNKLVDVLFDQDLVLTILDRVQAPVYHEVPEQTVLDILAEYGFKAPERQSSYHQYSNVRRFLAPMYFEHDHPLAKLLYGEGIMQYLATKE